LSQLRERLKAFEGQSVRFDQIQEVIRTVTDLPFNFTVFRTRDDRRRLLFIFADARAVIRTPFGAVVGGGPVDTPFGPQAAANPRAEVSSDTRSTDLISSVLPAYPPLAKQARIQGIVVAEAVIGPQGNVEDVRIVTGHPLLRQPTIDAVKHWVYRPQAGPVTSRIVINFRF
jgi:TonB family protein